MKKVYAICAVAAVFFCLPVFFLSCELLDPELKIPAYIHIDSIPLAADYGTQGSSSARIADAWVYSDEKLVGVFELPCTLPLLASGNHDLLIKAGIIMDGMAATRGPYPFYTIYGQPVALTAGSVININPLVAYYPATVFEWIEDFDKPGITIKSTAKSDTSVLIQKVHGDSAFEGGTSAYVSMNRNNVIFECENTSCISLPKGGASVYLELNYKTNWQVVTGLITFDLAGSIQEPVVILNPTATWKKIYISLTDMVSSHPDALCYRVFFGLSNTASAEKIELYLDNIKLVH